MHTPRLNEYIINNTIIHRQFIELLQIGYSVIANTLINTAMKINHTEDRWWFIPNFIIKYSRIPIRERLEQFRERDGDSVVVDDRTEGIYVRADTAAWSMCILMEIPMQQGWIKEGSREQVNTGLLRGSRIVLAGRQP